MAEEEQNHIDDENVGTLSASSSIKGFLDVMYERDYRLHNNKVSAVLLATYYLANFFYSLILTIVSKVRNEDSTYCLVYMNFSITCFILEEVLNVIKYCYNRKHTTQHGQAMRENDYYDKRWSILVNYVSLLLGEFLIYPILICTLYGFINEKAWQFNSVKSGCYFIFFLYSVIMDALYMKFYVICLVIGIVGTSYAKYELIRPRKVEWKYLNPVYMTIPFTIMTALTHWFMIGIIGVRIYVDNFTPENNSTNDSVPNTGDYKVKAYTGYMIACTMFLPIASWIVYIIINKLSFYEVYSTIYHLNNGADDMPPEVSLKDKIFPVSKDHLVYTATLILTVLFFIPLFIAFAVGSFLPDFDSSEFDSSVKDAIKVLGICYIILFVLSNPQAVVIFILSLIISIMAILTVSINTFIHCIGKKFIKT